MPFCVRRIRVAGVVLFRQKYALAHTGTSGRSLPTT